MMLEFLLFAFALAWFLQPDSPEGARPPAAGPEIPYVDEFAPHEYRAASGAQLPYRLLAPPRLNPGMTYPLFVFLHGAGERGTDNRAQLTNGVSEWLGREEVRARFPAFCLLPQCPEEERWSGDGQVPSSPGALVMEVLASVRAQHPIDPHRVYLGGLSLGGFGTWDLIAHFPDTFAAGVMICGGGDPTRAAQIVHVPFWLFHGGQDEAVPPARSHALVGELERLGGKVRYTEYPEVGHGSWFPAFQEPDLLPWLFAQHR